MPSTSDVSLLRKYTLFGRRKGKRLGEQKSGLLQNLLPHLKLDLSASVDPKKIFPACQDVWLEVGFGGGEHLAAQAALHPAIGMIGCEPFENGVASLLEHISKNNLQNVRILPDDARMLLDQLPGNSISRCFVLFPDPWPKKRHAYRRFIGPDNLPKLARVLKPGAELRIASDDHPLQDWMEEHMYAAPDFKAAVGTEKGLHPTRPADWPRTRYEEKALAKKKYADWRGPRYYSLIRV